MDVVGSAVADAGPRFRFAGLVRPLAQCGLAVFLDAKCEDARLPVSGEEQDIAVFCCCDRLRGCFEGHLAFNFHEYSVETGLVFE